MKSRKSSELYKIEVTSLAPYRHSSRRQMKRQFSNGTYKCLAYWIIFSFLDMPSSFFRKFVLYLTSIRENEHFCECLILEEIICASWLYLCSWKGMWSGMGKASMLRRTWKQEGAENSLVEAQLKGLLWVTQRDFRTPRCSWEPSA